MKTLKQYNAATQSWDVVGPVGSTGSTGVVDLTNATTDYPLRVGETATITYTNATSVPLHVATVEGVYEVIIAGDITTAAVHATDNSQFKPNNTNYPGAFAYYLQGGSGTYDCFLTTSGRILNAVISINTYTAGKSINLISCYRDIGSSISPYNGFGWWNDSTTWVSLGTIVFPFAQSGKIVIRRIC